MPMAWNAEAEAKLFAAVIQVTDLKFSQENLKKIAEIMGEDCTPKALTHRIAKYKTLAKNGMGEGEGAAEGEKTEKTKKAAAPKAKSKGGKAKKADTPVEDGDDEEAAAAEEEVKPKKKAAPKRKKATSEEVDEAKGKKNVKLEEEDAF